MKRNLSSYCNYNEAFTEYDQVRRPNGLRELLQIFKQTDIALEEQKVLEGGFGTGAYIDHIRHYVREVHGVEGSSEGFRQASQKMGNATNVICKSETFFVSPFLMIAFMSTWLIRSYIILIPSQGIQT